MSWFYRRTLDILKAGAVVLLKIFRILTLLLVSALLAPTIGFALDYGALKQLIQKKDIRSVDELLPLLPEDYRENFALQYKSGSSQFASPEFPRMILYGEPHADGKNTVLLAATTDPSKPGYQQLEVIHQRKDGFFDFISIEFPGMKKTAVKFLDGVSAPKPAFCVSCHSEEPHPNWTQFDHWPGTYASTHDSFTGKFIGKEAALFSAAISKNGKTSRLKYLAGLDPKGRAYLERSPAQELAEKITNMNQNRVSAIFRKLPEYEKYKYAIAAAFTRKEPIESFLPPELNQGARESYSEVYRSTLQAMKKSHRSLLLETAKLAGARKINPEEYRIWDQDSIDALARVRYVVESVMGQSMKDWPSTLERGSYRFSSGQGVAGFPGAWEILKKNDPDLEKIGSSYSFRELKTKSWVKLLGGPLSLKCARNILKILGND